MRNPAVESAPRGPARFLRVLKWGQQETEIERERASERERERERESASETVKWGECAGRCGGRS